jgi:hypothetical protein
MNMVAYDDRLIQELVDTFIQNSTFEDDGHSFDQEFVTSVESEDTFQYSREPAYWTLRTEVCVVPKAAGSWMV